MIDIQGLSKNFRTAPLNPFRKPDITRALEDVSFRTEAGTITALVGRNGAGKSTLMKILATVVLPDSGSARVNGRDVLREPAAVRACIGLSGGDERSFYWRLTGRQNLLVFAALQNVPRREIPAKVDHLLDLFGLAGKAGIPFRNYSSGMRQRLALARALLHNPRVLLLDEPNKGLDPLLQESFKNFLTNELVGKHAMTVLVATHDLDTALEIAHRVAFLDKGRLLFFGRPENAGQIRDMMKSASGESDKLWGSF